MSQGDEAELRRLLEKLNRHLIESPSPEQGLGSVAALEVKASSLIDKLGLKELTDLRDEVKAKPAFGRRDADLDSEGNPLTIWHTIIDPTGLVTHTRFNAQDSYGLDSGGAQWSASQHGEYEAITKKYIDGFSFAVRNWLDLLDDPRRSSVSVEMFPADHFRVKYGLKADTLNKARRVGRLVGEKRGKRWFYSLDGVKHLWPDLFTKND